MLAAGKATATGRARDSLSGLSPLASTCVCTMEAAPPMGPVGKPDMAM